MKTDFRKTRAAGGFILILTIVSLAALMILMIGVMSMVSLERHTARAYSDGVQAEMALDAGVAEARLRVEGLARKDGFLIHTGTGAAVPGARPVFFASAADGSGSGWRHVPMASGLAAVETGGAGFSPPGQPGGLENFLRNPPPGQDAPQAKWVTYETDAQGRQWRYAYWIEGMNGYLDGDLAGMKKRADGLDGRELSWFSFFDPKAEGKPESGPGEKLSAARGRVMGAGNLGLLLEPEEAEKIAPFVAFGLPETYERAVMPAGGAYAGAGEPAMDLNAAVAAEDVAGIADHIRRHLPDFEQRKGGFPADQDYLKTLAASIIDYADEDFDVTRGPDFRGVDSYPFVNEIFDRYVWRDGGSIRNPKIEVRTFVELWNPTNVEIEGKVRLKNINRHRLVNPGGGGTSEFGTVDLAEQAVSIPPNGYAVLEFKKSAGPEDYVVYVKNFSFDPPFSHSSSPKPNYLFKKTFDSSYKLYWNGAEVDWARGGMERTDGTLRQGDSQRKWKGQASVALQMDARARDRHGVPDVGRELGDPRASAYVDAPIFANSFGRNSNFGGRAYMEKISNSNYNEVKYSNWPDGGHDGMRGERLTSSKIPSRDAKIRKEPDLAPAYISNAGKYRSVGELGNIFDPAQWRDITVTDGMGAESRAGGGATLAVGRGEFAAFDRAGWRAADLLDLFYIRNDDPVRPAPKNLRALKGKVNVNTASREVLRALFAGVLLDEDPGEKKNFPAPKSANQAEIADVIVEAILARRKVKPFASLADLAALRNKKGALFGNEKQWGADGPGEDWDDHGREALFGKIANLVTFRSRCFRGYVSGQLLDPQGNVLGSRSRVLGFATEPARAGDGSILVGEAPKVTYFYEREL